MYATWDFYTIDYLHGKAPSIPEDDFPFWEQKARVTIDKYTSNRVRNIDCDDIPNDVRMATCALAEYFHNQSLRQSAFGADGVLLVASGATLHQDRTIAPKTHVDINNEIRAIVFDYLENTGLLFRGI